MFSNLRSYFSFLQLVGSLLSGPLIDTYGAKWVFLLNFVACVVCYGITATADSMMWLYISFLPTVFQHGVLAARAFISLTSTDQQLARRIGYVGLAYGLGFVIGPALGGWLTAYSLRAAAWIATAGSVLSIVLILTLMPDPKEAAKPKEAESSAEAGGLLSNASAAVGVLSSNPKVQLVLGMKVFFGCAMALLYSSFSLYLTDTFELSPAQYGGIMSFCGVIGMVTQAVLVQAAQANLDGFQVTALCGILLVAGFLGFAASGSWAHILLVMVPITVASTLLSNIGSAQLVASVGVDDGRGAVVAMDMGLGSAVRIVSPKATKWLVSAGGFPAVGISAAALMGGMLALAGASAATLKDLLVHKTAESEGKKDQ